MASSRKPKRARSYITGEKGQNRVRLFSHPRDGLLYLEFHDEGRKRRIGLQHADLTRGKAAAEDLAVALRRHERPPLEELTLQSLFDNYEREMTPQKSAGKQKHDRRARELFERCWGPNAKLNELDRRDWDRFVTRRRSGELRPLGGYRKGAVRDRVVAYDLKHLLAVCNWAERVRVNGKPLLDRNPFRGFPVPSESSPRRPIVSDDEYRQLQSAAELLGGQVPLFLLLAHETGHRCSAVAHLRWSDISFASRPESPWGEVLWRAQHDKIGYEHRTPLSPAASMALKAARSASGRIGDAWIFPAPGDPEKAVSRHLVRDWWEQLQVRGGLSMQPGRGWHSLRRKFATDLKDLALPDLAGLGGWKDTQTIVKSYQQPERARMRDALVERDRRRAVN